MKIWHLIAGVALLVLFAIATNCCLLPRRTTELAVTTVAAEYEQTPPWKPTDVLNTISGNPEKKELVFKLTDGPKVRVGKTYILNIQNRDKNPTAKAKLKSVKVIGLIKDSSYHFKVDDFKPLERYRGWVIKQWKIQR